MNNLEKLFLSELKDLYDGEQQRVQALPHREQKARSGELKMAFREHLEETRTHIKRLTQVFDEIHETPERKTCYGISGLLDEAQAMMRTVPGDAELDAGLIAAGQKTEHYEIASYGSLCSWAKELGHGGALQLLKQNLSEEKQADEKLARLAESCRNSGALFLITLREIYDAEHLLASALAELEKYAVSKLLKLAVHHHLNQTEKHSKRLEKVFKEIGPAPDRRPCKGIEGIIDEAQILVMEFLGNSAMDAGLIAGAQKAEHYEIATYTTLCSWAKELGQKRALDLLEKNLSDELETDKALTLLAKTTRNPEAARYDSPAKSDEEAELAKAITHGP